MGFDQITELSYRRTSKNPRRAVVRACVLNINANAAMNQRLPLTIKTDVTDTHLQMSTELPVTKEQPCAANTPHTQGIGLFSPLTRKTFVPNMVCSS